MQLVAWRKENEVTSSTPTHLDSVFVNGAVRYFVVLARRAEISS